jgi:MFS family permease
LIAAIAPVGALLLSVGLLLTGNGLQGTLLPVRASIENFSPLSIGVLGASYYIGFAVGVLGTPRLIARVGHIRLFTAMVAIASVAPLVHALVVLPPVWWVTRGLCGLCMASLYLIIESWLNERATTENRGAVFTTYTTVNYSVITLGQLLILADDPVKFPLYALASILVSVAAVPVALSRSPQPAQVTSPRLSFSALFRLSPVGVAGCMTVGLANGAFWALGPAFVLQSGLHVHDVALFMSATVVGGAVSQWPFGRISDRVDRRLMLMVSCIAAASSGAGIVLAGMYAPALVIPAGFLFGVFSFPVYALSVAHANDVARGTDFVAVAGGLLMTNGIASVIGPLLASGIMQAAGGSGLFAFTALVHAAMALFTVYRMRRRAAPLPQEKSGFVPMPAHAPRLADIDPRVEPGGDDDGPPPDDDAPPPADGRRQAA